MGIWNFCMPSDIPPLENGDRLTRHEFERRYEAMRHVILEPDADGIVHSEVFPGLRLAVQAMLDSDLAKVLAVLQEQLGREHADFVRQLAANSL